MLSAYDFKINFNSTCAKGGGVNVFGFMDFVATSGIESISKCRTFPHRLFNLGRHF